MQSPQVDSNPTNAELLSAIQIFANTNEKRLQGIESNVTEIKTILDAIATNVSTIQQDHVAAIDWLKRHDQNFAAHDKIIGHNCNLALAIDS